MLDSSSTMPDFLKSTFKYIVRYPLAILGSVVIIVIGTILLFLGKGEKFNVGGIISKLFGEDEDTYSKVEIANTIPEDRKEDKGEVDEEGYVQKEVNIVSEPKNPFRDKSKITIKDGEKEKTIKLPSGIKDTDVEKVYEADPEGYRIQTLSSPEDKDLDGLKDSLN